MIIGKWNGIYYRVLCINISNYNLSRLGKILSYASITEEKLMSLSFQTKCEITRNLHRAVKFENNTFSKLLITFIFLKRAMDKERAY